MAYDTRELAVKISADASEFTKATEQIGEGTKQASSTLENFGAGAKRASVTLGAVGVGLTAYAKTATDYTVNLVKSSKELSRQTGLSVEDSSRLVYVAQRMGVSADQASTVFGTFSKQISKAADESKKAGHEHEVLQEKIDKTKLEIQATNAEIAKNGDSTGALSLKVRTLNTDMSGLQDQMSQSSNAFEKLGINVVDTNGKTKDFNTLLLETADKFKAMQDGSEKTALVMQLFGRAGKDMIPILNQGSDGIQALEKQADKLGLTLNASTLGAVNKYIKAQKDLTDSSNALKVQVGTLTAPVLANFDNRVNSITKTLLNLHGPMHTAVVDTLAFGGPVAGAASGMAAFAGNLASAGPLVSKMALLMNPYTLAIGAAAIGVTILGIKIADSMDKTRHLGQAFDEQQDKLTGLGAHYASTTSLLQIFQDRQRMAEDAVTDATNRHKAAIDAIAPSQEIARQKADAITLAQQNVKTALDQFGKDSVQYKLAVDNLTSAEYLYNQQLLGNWGLEVNVKTSADNLASARSNLAASTADLNRIQGILNNGLDTGLTVISRYGPMAAAQVGAIDTLQAHISGVVSSFSIMSGNIQSQVPQINQQLAGISGALNYYQGQAATLNASLSGGSFNPQGGATYNPQHRAGGGSVDAGTPYIVGEKGQELFIPNQSGTIVNAKDTQNMLGSSNSNSINLTVNVGMYAGMPVEKRQIALSLYKELVRAARAQGVQLQMIGAIGVQ
jgi:hypothetical protein